MAKGIYKRGDVYWIRYAGLDGKVVFETSKSTKYREAELLLSKRRMSIAEGKEPEAVKRIGNFTFNQLALEYVAWAERQRGFEQKKTVVKRLVEVFGKSPLRHLSPKMLEQYQTSRLSINKPATINRHLATIKHMYTKAYSWDMVEEDYSKRIHRVPLLPENNKRLRFLSREESYALINACDAHLKPIVITALNTGMRRGELLKLKWEQVDLKHGFILLSDTKNGDRREIPINDAVRDALQSFVIRRLDVPYVFYDLRTGTPYDQVHRSFVSACKRTGIHDFKFHDLRHTFASQLVMAGVDIVTIKELLGHKTLQMTLRYAHLAPSHKVNAVNLLNKQSTEPATIQKLYNQG